MNMERNLQVMGILNVTPDSFSDGGEATLDSLEMYGLESASFQVPLDAPK
jgi:dihydropteroate synthase